MPAESLAHLAAARTAAAAAPATCQHRAAAMLAGPGTRMHADRKVPPVRAWAGSRAGRRPDRRIAQSVGCRPACGHGWCGRQTPRVICAGLRDGVAVAVVRVRVLSAAPGRCRARCCCCCGKRCTVLDRRRGLKHRYHRGTGSRPFKGKPHASASAELERRSAGYWQRGMRTRRLCWPRSLRCCRRSMRAGNVAGGDGAGQ
jgi:hypothetical protein